ncbi:hypothetical protein D3C84_747770 [compost metagenome]
MVTGKRIERKQKLTLAIRFPLLQAARRIKPDVVAQRRKRQPFVFIAVNRFRCARQHDGLTRNRCKRGTSWQTKLAANINRSLVIRVKVGDTEMITQGEQFRATECQGSRLQVQRLENHCRMRQPRAGRLIKPITAFAIRSFQPVKKRPDLFDLFGNDSKTLGERCSTNCQTAQNHTGTTQHRGRCTRPYHAGTNPGTRQ